MGFLVVFFGGKEEKKKEPGEKKKELEESDPPHHEEKQDQRKEKKREDELWTKIKEKNRRIRHLERELGDCRRKKRRIEDEFFEMKKCLDYLERKDRQRRASEDEKRKEKERIKRS